MLVHFFNGGCDIETRIPCNKGIVYSNIHPEHVTCKKCLTIEFDLAPDFMPYDVIDSIKYSMFKGKGLMHIEKDNVCVCAIIRVIMTKGCTCGHLNRG